MGREVAFSSFMLKQLKLIHKKSSKNVKWVPLIEAFEHYPQENVFQRKRTINRFVSLLKSELNSSKNEECSSSDVISTSLYDADVVMLKGVGPKFGYLLN